MNQSFQKRKKISIKGMTLIVAKNEAKKRIILGLDIQTEYGLLIPPCYAFGVIHKLPQLFDPFFPYHHSYLQFFPNLISEKIFDIRIKEIYGKVLPSTFLSDIICG